MGAALHHSDAPITALEVNHPQADFLQLNKKFKAFVAGFGSGKTWVGCQSQCAHYRMFPKVNQGYFAPTYPQIRDIFYPTIEEVAFSFGMSVKINVSNKEVHFSKGRKSLGTTMCRSMNDPGSIVGFKIGRALVDELDTLPTDKARHAWRKIIARMRYNVPGVLNGIDVTTTPEGFKFVYQQFYGNESEHYGLVQASTLDNEQNLPEDYIDSLIDSYPAELIDAYLDGQFVNLTSGTVYRNFDRRTCACDTVIEPGEPLYIGQDFNVNQMASVIYVKRNAPPVSSIIHVKDTTEYHAVGELTRGVDTPAVCVTLKNQFPGHKITIFPDASGAATSSKGASVSDIALLKQAGFAIRVRNTNPLIKDRVLSMNTGFSHGRIKVNLESAPQFAACLEMQAYDDNGMPDKSSGFDHLNDAGSYPMAYLMPINRPTIIPRQLPGLIS